MNRRIIDNVVITQLAKHGDEKLTKQVLDMFGEGSLVETPKHSTVLFNKSMFGLQETNISNPIRRLSKGLLPAETGNYVIADSTGKEHTTTREVISILKAVTFHEATCHPVLASCLNQILLEIDTKLKGERSVDLVTITVDVDEDGLQDYSSNKELMNTCRKEILSLLKEAGLNIE